VTDRDQAWDAAIFAFWLSVVALIAVVASWFG
jgi:hypothetical protein